MTSYRLRPRVARLLRAVTGPLYLPLRALFVRATHSVWSPDIVLDYWRNPETRDHDNDPQHYLQGAQRSGFLLNLIRANVPTDARVLEVGCNVGRNLNHLLAAGYRNLTGIEINANAIALLRRSYSELARSATLINSSLEDAVPKLRDGEFDAVYTMAVLMHIHPQSDWVLEHLARATRSIIITIEDEVFTGGRVFARNYRRIFEGFGFHQVYETNCAHVPGLGDSYTARVLSRPTVAPASPAAGRNSA